MPKPVRKMRDHDTNPCLEETDASSKCMDVNHYEKDLCASYFMKYKNCRKFWALCIKRLARSKEAWTQKVLNLETGTVSSCRRSQSVCFTRVTHLARAENMEFSYVAEAARRGSTHDANS
ncbi:coiled-coil-helix-coiled-coil-helix domain-containing protein 7 isoform X2 [Ambystoma mexicanum]|uniref:coiled-coil-helix-coiled-coil-helix domain-containing protein 7 isoform X2 n=1 Tax=Ambystoma mexicanum TaxID=8296 RepID=UPI0037E8383A